MTLTLGYEPEWCFASIMENGKRVSAKHVKDGNEGIGPLAGDAVRATFGLKQGITYSFQSYQNCGAAPWRFGLRIYGSEGIIEIMENVLPEVWILQDPSWNTGRSGKVWQRVSSAGIDKSESLIDPKFKRRHHVPIEHLLTSIEKQQEPKCGMYEGRKIIEMIAAVFESHVNNQPVTLPLHNRNNPLLSL